MDWMIASANEVVRLAPSTWIALAACVMTTCSVIGGAALAVVGRLVRTEHIVKDSVHALELKIAALTELFDERYARREELRELARRVEGG